MASATSTEIWRPSEFKNPSSNVPWRLAVGGVAMAGLIAADQGLPVYHQRRTEIEAAVISQSSSRENHIFTLPGCRSAGEIIAEILQPKFSDLGDTSFAVYPRKGFSLASVKERLLEARRLYPTKEASFYAISMGGLVLAQLLRDQEFRDEFGPINKIVFDSSPSGLDTIRASARRGLVAARVARNSWTLSRASRSVLMRQSKLDQSISVDDRFEQLRRATVEVSLSTIRAQADFMRQARVEPYSLAGTVNQAYFLRSQYDDVVDTDKSFADYRAAFGNELEEFVDDSRPGVSHAAGVRYPEVVVELLRGDISKHP